MLHLIVIVPYRSNKGCLLLIIHSQGYLVVSLKGIQKAHLRMTYSGIHQLVDPRHGEMVFRTCSVQICEVHTYPSLSFFLLHHHSIGQPFRVKHFFNCPSLLKFHHLVFDGVRMILRGASRWLLSRDDGWVNVQMMKDKGRTHPWSFESIPSEYINFLLEEFHQLLFLLRWQLSSNLKKLLWITTYSKFL